MSLVFSEISLLLCSSFLAMQLFFWAPFLRKILSLFLGEHASLYFRGGGFFFPFFYFSARDFHFLYYGSLEQDRFYLEAKRIHFLINPFFLCIGRLRINRLYLKKPLLHYFNRQDSYKKKQIMPYPGRFQIKNMCVQKGFIYVEDDSIWPVYRLYMKNIEIYKMAVDLAVPVLMFFQIQNGYAQLAGGQLQIRRRAKKGLISLQQANWRDIASLQNLPLDPGKIELRAHFHEYHKNFFIEGLAGSSKGYAQYLEELDRIENGGGDSKKLSQENHEKKSGGIKFKFQVHPQNYQTTLDLGLQKLIEEILENAETNWRSMGLIWSGRRLFKLFKKTDK